MKQRAFVKRTDTRAALLAILSNLTTTFLEDCEELIDFDVLRRLAVVRVRERERGRSSRRLSTG